MQASEFIWLHCFTLLKVPQFCVCPLLLASHYFRSTLFSFQGATSSLFQDQIETSVARCFDPISNRAHLKFSLLPFFFKRKEVVGPSGLEPPTSRLSVVRSSQLSYGPVSGPLSGGDNRARTDDPLLAKQMLSQLSYTPISCTL